MASCVTKPVNNRQSGEKTTLISETGNTGMAVADSANEDHRILVIGKSGNGKSAVCNTLTAGQSFKTGKGLSATTRSQQVLDVNRLGHNIRVIDTPDVTNCNMTSSEMKEAVRRWRHLTDPHPTIVLLAVRCDVRFTPEEYTIYRQIKELWGDNSMTDRLVVIFTFADRQDDPIEQELPSVCLQLKAVLGDASQRYLLCNNMASDAERNDVLPQLLNLMKKTTPASGQRQKTSYWLMGFLSVLAILSGLGLGAFIGAWICEKSMPSWSYAGFTASLLLCGLSVAGLVRLSLKGRKSP